MRDEQLIGLREALDRSTDRIETPALRSRVLREVRRRRVRRHGLVTLGAAAATAAVIVVVWQFPGGSPGERPAAPSTASSATPEGSSSGPSTAPGPPIDPSAVQSWWDPFTVEKAPLRPSVLPQDLVPPEGAPEVADQPMTAAVLAWPQEGKDLRLLDVDGTWRTVSRTADGVHGTLDPVVNPVVTEDGQRVAMATNDGLLVLDVTTGDRRTIPWPDRFAAPWDTAPSLEWMPGDEELLIDFWGAPWVFGLDGVTRRAAYSGETAVDPTGTIVERRWNKRDLRVWKGDEIESAVGFQFWGERLSAAAGRVALTGGGAGLPGDGGPMVVDTASGELLAYAPIRDRDSVYSDNGHLTSMGFLDRDTVLLLVGPTDFRTMEEGDESWHLVAWDIRTGDFERLSSGDTTMRRIAVAPDVIASG